MKCRNCGQEGHIGKDCPQPSRKGSPEKEKKGKGKGKSKFRQVEEGGEPEEEADEESTAAGGETFMAVRNGSESRAVETADTTRKLVSSRDSSRVESVRILKPPGDECFTWLVDSGATCHIVASRFLECYRVVRRHQGTTTLTGANGMPIPVQGICDLEVRVGKEKISLGSVVIADIDFNVLSCFSMQERGWRTVLGAKNLYVVKGKMRFPIQMAERAWWMTVKSTRRDNCIKPMDVDRVGVMISAEEARLAKVETTKVAKVAEVEMTKVAKERAAGTPLATDAPKAGPDLVESQARSLVLHETRDAAILAARALECKPFGVFSFVCRMLRQGGVSDETFGGLPVTVELDGEEGELASPGLTEEIPELGGGGPGEELEPWLDGTLLGAIGLMTLAVELERLLNQKALELTFSSLGTESTRRCSSWSCLRRACLAWW